MHVDVGCFSWQLLSFLTDRVNDSPMPSLQNPQIKTIVKWSPAGKYKSGWGYTANIGILHGHGKATPAEDIWEDEGDIVCVWADPKNENYCTKKRFHLTVEEYKYYVNMMMGIRRLQWNAQPLSRIHQNRNQRHANQLRNPKRAHRNQSRNQEAPNRLRRP